MDQFNGDQIIVESTETTTTTTTSPSLQTTTATGQLDIEDRVARLNALLRLESRSMKPIRRRYGLELAKNAAKNNKKLKAFLKKHKLKKDEVPRTEAQRIEREELDYEYAKSTYDIIRRELEELRPHEDIRAAIIQGRMIDQPEVLDTRCYKCKKSRCAHKVRLTNVVTRQCKVDEQCILEEEANFKCSLPKEGLMPWFWFSALFPMSRKFCHPIDFENDPHLLGYLMDIRMSTAPDEISIQFDYHFAKNPFFDNQVLVRYYRFVPPKEGTEDDLTFTTGTVIQWKEEDLDVTKKGSSPSFFNIFTPPIIPVTGSSPLRGLEIALDLTGKMELRTVVAIQKIIFDTALSDNTCPRSFNPNARKESDDADDKGKAVGVEPDVKGQKKKKEKRKKGRKNWPAIAK